MNQNRLLILLTVSYLFQGGFGCPAGTWGISPCLSCMSQCATCNIVYAMQFLQTWILSCIVRLVLQQFQKQISNNFLIQQYHLDWVNAQVVHLCAKLAPHPIRNVPAVTMDITYLEQIVQHAQAHVHNAQPLIILVLIVFLASIFQDQPVQHVQNHVLNALFPLQIVQKLIKFQLYSVR